MLQELLRILFVLATAPIWWPFAKAMWQELNDLLEEDGGLFGEEPPPRRKAELREARARRPSPLVHEWVAHFRPTAGPRGEGAAPNAAAPAPPKGLQPRPRSAERRFR